MLKQDYLQDLDVNSFVTWFSKRLLVPLQHRYTTADDVHYEFDSLSSALEQYDWDFRLIYPGKDVLSRGHTYAENVVALNTLQTGLFEAISAVPVQDETTLAWAGAVMRWGGVAAHNNTWLETNVDGLTTVLISGQNALRQNDDTVLVGRFNAGMSKIYSLIVDDFIIYDSRVAAALAWLVSKWAHERGMQGAIPALLYFPCLRPKEAVEARLRKLRKPGCLHFQWNWMAPAQHVRWNLRASWILRAVLNSASSSTFHEEQNPLRALEAALFMWGYDLAHSPVCNEPEADDEGSEVIDADEKSSREHSAALPVPVIRDEDGCHQRMTWRPGVTRGGRAKSFCWMADQNQDALIIRKADHSIEQFNFGELFLIVHELFDVFGYDFFPLANNVELLQAGQEKAGLGSIIMNVRPGEIGHAQAASQIGVVLETVGLLEWNGRSRGIKWRIKRQLPSTIDDLRQGAWTN
jgi:hypothetical protein